MTQMKNYNDFLSKVWHSTKTQSMTKATLQDYGLGWDLGKGATHICVMNGSLNSLAYQDILQTHLLPSPQQILPQEKFQDNAPCHTLLSTSIYFTCTFQ